MVLVLLLLSNGYKSKRHTSGNQRAEMKPLNVIGFLFAALLSVLGPVLASAQSVELSEIDR